MEKGIHNQFSHFKNFDKVAKNTLNKYFYAKYKSDNHLNCESSEPIDSIRYF